MKKLTPASSGSRALDILCLKDITITPGQCPYMLKTGIIGPISPNKIGLYWEGEV